MNESDSAWARRVNRKIRRRDRLVFARRIAPYLVAIVLGVCFSGILDWFERWVSTPNPPRRIRAASDG